MENEQKIITACVEETIEAGSRFAEMLTLPDIVLLYGDLGVGKTEFCRGVCRYFGVEGKITSPTFTIINQYFGMKDDFEFPIYHIDLYRIKNQKEFPEIGFNEFLYDDNSIKLIEWPEKYLSPYPENVIEVYFNFTPENKNKRIIRIIGSSKS